MAAYRPVSLAHAVAHALERGRFDGVAARAMASVVTPFATRGLARPAIVPEDVALVCVGGATLGGSGKTRVAIAVAKELARLGVHVALVGHGYRVALPSARVVSPSDALEDVGDEALVCARALADANVPVVIGPTRQAALGRALRLAPRPNVLVLDGPLAIRGREGPNAVSLLAVDASRPWGSGRLPPAGDLRAPREALLERAHHVVPVDATPTRVRWASGEVSPMALLKSRMVGLFTAIARPDRLVRALATLGVHPRAIVSVPDHGPVDRARPLLAAAAVDAWIATEKCALHLARESLALTVGTLESDFRLPQEVLGTLAATGPACLDPSDASALVSERQ